MAFHLWGAGQVSGGVDVFLMISAYLMVGAFLRRGTDFRLGDFLANRFRRLVPQAVLVVVVVLAVACLMLPPVQWDALLSEATATVLYWQNWHLMAEAADYYAADHSAASPLQHYWSMSVQGQIFVAWPLLMVLAIGIHKLTRVSLRVTLGAIFGVVTVASFIYAVITVRSDPVAAYFDTFARAWEFALPSLLATLPDLRLSKTLSVIAGWVGVLAVCAGGFVVGNQHFPSWAALWPVLAASLVVLAGASTSRASVGAVLSNRVMSTVADRAYAIYLWHWPVLVFVLVWSGKVQVGWRESLLVLAITAVLTECSTRLDQGLQSWRALRRPVVAVAMMLACILFAGGVIVAAPRVMRAIVPGTSEAIEHPGAAAIVPGEVAEQPESALSLAPGPTEIGTDYPEAPGECPEDFNPKPAGAGGHMCGQVRPEGTPTKHVVMMGSSHMFHWTPEFVAMAHDRGWQLDIITYPTCDIRPPEQSEIPDCNEYNAGARDYIMRHQPDIVVGIATKTTFGNDAGEVLNPWYVEAMQPYVDAGMTVVSVRDNPRFPFHVPECVQTHGPRSPECQAPVSEKMSPEPLMEQLAAHPGFEATIDITDQFCPGDVCPGTIGNVYVYQDQSHPSETYAKTLAPVVAERWDAVVDR